MTSSFWMAWTPLLLSLQKDGFSANLIASAISRATGSKVSRGAVIGRLYRLGLSPLGRERLPSCNRWLKRAA